MARADRIAARQIDDAALRFGGENEAAALDPTVNTQVLGGSDRATEMGLRNIDRVADADSCHDHVGPPYYQLGEVYQARSPSARKSFLP
jgi:hypothetical protein